MLLSATAFDSVGTKVGDVRQVYLDDATGRATFATVATGIFSSDALVPLFGSRLLDGELHLAHTKATVKDSPRFDNTEDSLAPEQERDLLEHYGLEVPPLEGGADAAPSGDRAERPQEESGNEKPGTIPARRLASVDGGAKDDAAPTPATTAPSTARKGSTPASATGSASASKAASAKGSPSAAEASESTPAAGAEKSPKTETSATSEKTAAATSSSATTSTPAASSPSAAKGDPGGQKTSANAPKDGPVDVRPEVTKDSPESAKDAVKKHITGAAEKATGDTEK